MDTQIIAQQQISFKVAGGDEDEFELEFGAHISIARATIAMWRRYGRDPQTALFLQASHDAWYTNLRTNWCAGLRDRKLVTATNAAYGAAMDAYHAAQKSENESESTFADECAEWNASLNWNNIEQMLDEENYAEAMEE